MESDVDGSARWGVLFSLFSGIGCCSSCDSVDVIVVAEEVMLGAEGDEVDERYRSVEDGRNDLVV